MTSIVKEIAQSWAHLYFAFPPRWLHFLCTHKVKPFMSQESGLTSAWICVCSFVTGGTVIKNPPANAGVMRDMGLIPGSGRYLGVENGKPLQYSCLENSMGRGAWWASPWGHKELGMTEWLTHTHILHIIQQIDYSYYNFSSLWKFPIPGTQGYCFVVFPINANYHTVHW